MGSRYGSNNPLNLKTSLSGRNEPIDISTSVGQITLTAPSVLVTANGFGFPPNGSIRLDANTTVILETTNEQTWFRAGVASPSGISPSQSFFPATGMRNFGIQTQGFPALFGDTGKIYVESGALTNDGFLSTTGEVSIRSGRVTGALGPAQSGIVNIESGSTQGANSGPVEMNSGTVNGGTGNSGDASLGSGFVTGSGNSGNTVIFTGGTLAGTGNSGNIQLITGASTATRGSIIMNALAVQFPQAAADPATTVGGAVYYNTATGKLRVYNDVLASWEDLN